MLSRWLSPLAKYRRYINGDIEPFYADEEIAVLGINTARSNVIKGGRVNREQVARSCARFGTGGNDVTRIIVTHHPFDLPENDDGSVVGRADMAMAGFAGCRVDLILSGHMHVSHRSASATRYRIAGYSALMVQAGTATSSRRRGEPNSYNIIRIDRPGVVVDTMTWDNAAHGFALAGSEEFHLTPEGWSPAAG